MADVFYKGIPVNKAVLVRHTPYDERHPTQKNNKGAIPITKFNLKLADDYISREGEFEAKGDIDRELTQDDIEKFHGWQNYEELGTGLDYIARMGNFESKGAERQFDATLWNEYGPVNRYQVEKEMIEAGGAYIDSIVTVDRRYAQQLGIVSKQDFQRLIRGTWTENALEWTSKLTHKRMFSNRDDVRWVAAYHTDADKNIHVHIHTWNAKGTIQAGDTCLTIGTRLGKEIILDKAYENIRLERNVRQEFLRNLTIAEIKNQLGLKIDDSIKQKLETTARRNRFEEKLSQKQELKPPVKEECQKLLKEIKNKLEHGDGRISRNKEVQALTEKLIKITKENSLSLQNLEKKNEEAFYVKAGIKGYSYDTSKPELEKQLNRFLDSERKELLTREKNQIIKEVIPQRETRIELKQELRHLDCSRIENAENISFSSKLSSYEINETLVNNSKYQYIKTPMSSPSNPQFVKIPSKDLGEINEAKATLAKINLKDQYTIVNSKGKPIKNVSGDKLVQMYGKANMKKIKHFNREITAETIKKEKIRQEIKKRQKERKEQKQEQTYKQMPKDTQSRLNQFSLKYGLSLEATRNLQYNVAKLSQEMQQAQNMKERYEQKNYIDNYAKLAVKEALRSEDVIKQIDKMAEFTSKTEGIDKNDIKAAAFKQMESIGQDLVKNVVEKEVINEDSSRFKLNVEKIELGQENNLEQSVNNSINGSDCNSEFGNLLASLSNCGSVGGGRGRRLKFNRELDEEEKREFSRTNK